jgi:hypothetical protein
MATKQPQQPPKIVSRLAAITPYELYIQQVKGSYDAIRAGRDNSSYFPNQFGGLQGQLIVLDEVLVLDLIDFEVT